MIDIFEVRGNQLTISDMTLSLKSFRDIWEADKSKKKNSAMDQFLFIYHMHHPKSPYAGYPDADRETSIRKNELSSTLRTSKRLEQAIEDFIRLRDEADPIFPLFRSAQAAVYKLTEFFNTIDPKSEDFDIKKITTALKDIGPMIKSYNELEEQVKEKIYTTTKTRGNREINPFEE